MYCPNNDHILYASFHLTLYRIAIQFLYACCPSADLGRLEYRAHRAP